MKEYLMAVEILFPAQAGVIPAKERAKVLYESVPRASGGDPYRQIIK